MEKTENILDMDFSGLLKNLNDALDITEEKVICFVNKKFKDKKDKGGNPYIEHLLFVADKVKNEENKKVSTTGISTLSIFYHKARIVALLHDIIEDTDCTWDDLHKLGCDPEICEAIDALTHKDNENYFEYIIRVSENDIAKIVKKYDLENNMDITRLKTFGEYEQKRLEKYWYSYKYLCGEISIIDAHNAIYPNNKWFLVKNK